MSYLGINGKKFLVTASTRGIGKGIAKVLLREGAVVTINGRSDDSVRRAVSELSSIARNRVYGVAADLTVESDVRELVSRSVSLMGGLDGFAYVTGPPKGGRFTELSIDDWDYGVKLLIMSALWLTKYSLPHILKSRGSMVFLTSVAIREPIPMIALSNTLRISIAGLVKTLAKELGPKGVRVNMVLPGHILTDRQRYLAERWAREKGSSPKAYFDMVAKKVPMGRLGTPEEVGEVVAFLLSPRASYVNGASIPVDGGLLNHVF
ncbi:MAG: short-chain dehydrogenase [Thermoprotei archaeon]|nr:MAG: short-chain dehydrogenase [Thermoprotei archaeon]